jgi:hypothetical protein
MTYDCQENRPLLQMLHMTAGIEFARKRPLFSFRFSQQWVRSELYLENSPNLYARTPVDRATAAKAAGIGDLTEGTFRHSILVRNFVQRFAQSDTTSRATLTMSPAGPSWTMPGRPSTTVPPPGPPETVEQFGTD